MAIPAHQLETWSHQGSVTTARQTHESIRKALEAYNWTRGVQYEVYLQGSYKNDTNVRGNSDVDVVMQLNSAFLSNLSDNWNRHFRFTSATYDWNEFRGDVLRALREYYGYSKVREGKKSLKVETSYLPADVVVCVQYRKYPKHPRSEDDFTEGITFWVPSESRWVINYPKLHYENGVRKNQSTNGRYKSTVRMFKNARTNIAAADLAPSYFLECLLYNVPTDKFSSDFQRTFYSVIHWLSNADFSQFICQNEQLPLFGNSPEQWSEDRARHFIKAMEYLWNNWR